MELYPTAADDSACSALNFSRVPAALEFSALYTPPLLVDAAVPGDAELEEGYLNKGHAVVVGGSTLYELQALD